jgi:hypothetical protein
LTDKPKQPIASTVWLISGILIVAGAAITVFSIVNFNRARIIVEWSTASELDTIGFNVLRGENPDGPFEKVNQQIIPTSDQPLSGGEYTYTDEQALRGKTYYYFLEDLSSSGTHATHGPIEIRAKNDAPIGLGLGCIFMAGAILMAWFIRKPRYLPDSSESE